MVQFTLARALPTPLGPPSWNVLIPYLRGQQVPWGRIFNIFWQSTSSSTLWYNLLWLARFQPRSAPPPGMFWSHIYGDSKSLGAEFLTYSDRARPVLPYGRIYFGVAFGCQSLNIYRWPFSLNGVNFVAQILTLLKSGFLPPALKKWGGGGCSGADVFCVNWRIGLQTQPAMLHFCCFHTHIK